MRKTNNFSPLSLTPLGLGKNVNEKMFFAGKESKESHDINATAVKNINDSSSNIEEDERASCNDGNNLDASSDEVVVEAKRRRKSPPVQISRQQSQPHKEDFNESLETNNAVPKIGKGLSLKSASDLEAEPSASAAASEATSTSSSSAGKEEGNQDMAGSIQAALAALQAGQISLNQVISKIYQIPTHFTISFQNFSCQCN